MKTIKKIHKAQYTPIAFLNTYTALPTSSLDYLDPFLLLHHHGPQNFEPNNQGLPFGPHPHRGFETLTFIIDGDITLPPEFSIYIQGMSIRYKIPSNGIRGNQILVESNLFSLERSILNSGDKIEFQILDNGKGMDEEQNSFGNGLVSMKKRAQELQTKLLIQKLEKGTSISFQIQAGKSVN